jgi:hypothetical protein
VAVIGTFALAAAAAASASASSARALEGDLVIPWIDLDEHRALVRLRVLHHRHAPHRAADPRRDWRDVRIDLRIVGGFAAARRHEPRRARQDDDHHDRRQDAYSPTRHFTPPRYFSTASSAVPSDRARSAFETL